MSNKIICFCVLLCLAIPAAAAEVLDVTFDQESWITLKYGDIPANEITLDGETLGINVNGSSSPTIYRLPRPATVSAFSIRASVDGVVRLPAGVPQGNKDADDFRLRVGLVYSGDKRLNFMQKMVAPGWVKKLYELAPEGQGISRIEFFGSWTDPSLAQITMVHPDSELLVQHFVLAVDEQGGVEQRVATPVDAQVLALWISSDGDQTGSSFTTRIDRLELELAD